MIQPVRWATAISTMAAFALVAGGCPPREEPPPNQMPYVADPGPTITDPQEVTVTAHEFHFDPSDITVQPGREVHVILHNEGEAPHNIRFVLAENQEEEIAQNVEMGEIGTLQFTAPLQEGEYEFYCPVGDHREQGMTGRLIVQNGMEDEPIEPVDTP
jgi:plastocyanin